MARFQLGRKTILDPSTPEFIWLDKLVTDNVPKDQIILLIEKCLGGDDLIATAMIETAEQKMSRIEFAHLVEKYEGKLDVGCYPQEKFSYTKISQIDS